MRTVLRQAGFVSLITKNRAPMVQRSAEGDLISLFIAILMTSVGTAGHRLGTLCDKACRHDICSIKIHWAA